MSRERAPGAALIHDPPPCAAVAILVDELREYPHTRLPFRHWCHLVSDHDFAELIELAFHDKLIDSMGHAVVKEIDGVI